MKKLYLLLLVLLTLNLSIFKLNALGYEFGENNKDKCVYLSYEVSTDFLEVRKAFEVKTSGDLVSNGKENSKIIVPEGNSSAKAYRITDDGESSNPADIIDMNFDLVGLRTVGYKTVVIEVRIRVVEVDDGYQYISILRKTNNGEYLLCRKAKFAHKSNAKDVNFKEYTFYMEYPANAFETDIIMIEYGASGFGEDDWICDGLSYEVGMSREECKADKMWYTNDPENAQTVTWYELNS